MKFFSPNFILPLWKTCSICLENTDVFGKCDIPKWGDKKLFTLSAGVIWLSSSFPFFMSNFTDMDKWRSFKLWPSFILHKHFDEVIKDFDKIVIMIHLKQKWINNTGIVMCQGFPFQRVYMLASNLLLYLFLNARLFRLFSCRLLLFISTSNRGKISNFLLSWHHLSFPPSFCWYQQGGFKLVIFLVAN